jgi:zinc protease
VRANLAPTLDLLAEIMRQPSFPPAELETQKRSEIAALEEGRTDPRSIAVRALGRYDNPYPAGDGRYTPTLDEAIKQIQTPDVDALKSFHQRFYGGAAAEIAIVGDFDAPTVKAQLERLFGDWKSPSAFTRIPEPLVAKRANAMPIETPDKANAFLTGSTSFALNDRDPDYPAFLLANYLLGGSTNSRLWNRVRQKEGLSYGIGSGFRASSFEPNGLLSISAIFAPQNLQSLRTAVQDEIKRASSEGFSATEVEDGKKAMLQERRLARTQDAGLADALTQQAYLGRTFAYSGEVDAAIAKLTPEAVNAALRKYMQPDAFAFVFAGDFAKTRQ